MLNCKFPGLSTRFSLLALVGVLLLVSSVVVAQTTISQGSIQGTVTDPSGAVVSGAKIKITNKATGQVFSSEASSSGTYSSGGLIPGEYVVHVEAKGFKSSELPVTVQVAVTATGNVKLEVGQESQVIEVQGNAVTVNTEQATVQGVLTADQIDKLPVDGRNFLDLAQLEPGVQIQDGQTFDPTKAGYSSISINGVYGRTPRIELDGLDISDENVGTTTQNVALSSIQEFNISRSNLDLSTELTSAGAVNVATRSGSNALHGMGFYNFRDRNALTAPFRRGRLWLLPAKQFWWSSRWPNREGQIVLLHRRRAAEAGRLVPVAVAILPGLNGGFNSPFRDTAVDRQDGLECDQGHPRLLPLYVQLESSPKATFGYDYSVYSNKDNAPSHAVGVWTGTKGAWSHSFRFGYLKFHNQIAGSYGYLQSGTERSKLQRSSTPAKLSPVLTLLAPQGTLADQPAGQVRRK